ncbi:hypothetical protein [Roseovarius dicentrarchi]|uniref:hypothetical protein n=1 Tax=Roseovarius dicentrarchi TaxID=2250573 RepID=UPI0013966AF8|nr:hypothetical protein [Roseovarius dicentrarchi]
MLIKDFHDEWTQNICGDLEIYRGKYLEYFEDNYSESLEISPEDWGRFLGFLDFYNYSRSLCAKKNELQVPVQELVPSLAWIRYILFPDEHPHPDDIEEDLPAP